ncbi:MAG: TIM barrel protein [Terricaulis sp.]
MAADLIAEDQIAAHNAERLPALQEDYAHIARVLGRRGVSAEHLKTKARAFEMATPTWGAGVGGTRFAKFPIPGEPTNINEKLEDCGVVQQLSRVTPRVSPHFPWDWTDDPEGLRQRAAELGLGFDAVNSNTFQDQRNQRHSYRHGSLTHTDAATRSQAVEHNVACIEIGRKLGSKALTVWIGDGTNFPGQQSFAKSFDRYLDSAAQIYAALPGDWRMLLEHKMYEPAFYSTVISDWGSSLMAAQQLGDKAQCLVDLGHHAPNVNIEQIVARLNSAGKLGGFHFNDSKYGDDDLDSGSINPHQLFLVFNELVEAERGAAARFNPAYMIDQSHNVTDPIESLLSSAEAIVQAFVKAEAVERDALAEAQAANDVMGAFLSLRRAYNADVSAIVALARVEAGGAADPIALYRSSGWREIKAQQRTPASSAAGIV